MSVVFVFRLFILLSQPKHVFYDFNYVINFIVLYLHAHMIAFFNVDELSICNSYLHYLERQDYLSYIL